MYDNSSVDERKVVSISVFPLFNIKKSSKQKEEILYIAELIIEHRDNINLKLNWIEDIEITKSYTKKENH